MIPRERFCNKIRELDYSFQRQADRVMIWKQKGSTNRIFIPRKDMLDDDFVRNALKQAGLGSPEIENFVANNKQCVN